jgi:shikimate kinase
MGSGAQEIGKQVAEKLQIDYIDRQIIAQVAERLNESKQDVIAKEMPPGSLWGRIAQVFGFDSAAVGSYSMEPGFVLHYSGAYLPAWQIPLDDTRYLSGLESVIKDLARSHSAVICGRGSQFILKNHPGALHVLVVAPLELRIKRVMERMAKTREDAEKEIEHSDNSRREFIRRYFKADMEDPVHHDLVVSTEHLSFEDAASIIIHALSSKTE